jgi:hypothetical protein
MLQTSGNNGRNGNIDFSLDQEFTVLIVIPNPERPVLDWTGWGGEESLLRRFRKNSLWGFFVFLLLEMTGLRE